jgi:hypothetical protein
MSEVRKQDDTVIGNNWTIFNNIREMFLCDIELSIVGNEDHSGSVFSELFVDDVLE